LQYVGSATYCFDKRVWQQHRDWNDRWVFIIRFSESTMFMALALEALLIQNLNPPRNKHWVSQFNELNAQIVPNCAVTPESAVALPGTIASTTLP